MNDLPETYRVGIIGAGAAGLAAAYDLVSEGCHVDVYESAPFLGGQASTFLINGVPIERGYHHLFTSDQSMIGLITELGLSHKLKWIDSNVGYFTKGKLWKFTSPFDLLAFRPIPLWDRVKLGLLTLMLQRRKEWKSLEKTTASEWLLKNAGSNIYYAIFEPMLRGKFGRYYDQITMAWLWNKFALRTASRGKGIAGKLKEQLAYPSGSFGEIFDTLAKRIEDSKGKIHLSKYVKKIVIENNRVSGLEVASEGESPSFHSYDQVLATVPSFVLPKILEHIPEDYLSKLTDKTYLSAVLVILELDRALTPHYWTYVGDRELPFLGIIEHTNFIPAEYYNGAHIVYLTNYLEQDDPMYKLSPEELYQEYIPHLQKINPNFRESWVTNYYYHKVDAAQPIVTKGYTESIPSHRTPFKDLYLANTTQIYPEDRGTNYSVRMGRNVAQLMKEDRGLN